VIPEEYFRSGKVVREVRQWVRDSVRPGMALLEISRLVEREIEARGGKPAFPCGLGLNHVTAHYAPQEDDASVFGEDDLLKVDFGVHIDGYITDTAVTMTFNPEHQLLLEATERALEAAIETVKRDTRVGEVGRAIFQEARRLGFRTIENLSGHTLERYVVHAGKSIPNLFMPNQPSLRNSEVFAIEPFLTLGDASGYVVDSPQKTIFSLIARRRVGERELDEFMDTVWDERKTLPFTPRWYLGRYSRQRLDEMLGALVKRKVVRAYPTLVEASGRPVAQFEHTMALDGGSLTILT
jgi:methionyl aminopeptidase